VPSIGGIVELRQPHSSFLLPSEVALFEPTQAEIFHARSGTRQIFLNTPLTSAENEALGEMHSLLAQRGIGGDAGDFPKYMEQHALRMLQACKLNVPKAVEMMKTCTKERVRRLPLAEADVEQDLKSGFVYWHGRDRQCRPCLVIRLERLGEIAKDKERAVQTVIFALEYALRYAMVPGRVENWVVLVDLANVMSVISPFHISSIISTAAAIGTTLEKVYSGRMVWIKIINMPGGALLSRAINGAIPAEKKDKVGFSQNYQAELATHFEPNQLERRYGGAAPDLQPAETYPYHFFPNPRGETALRGPAHSDACSEGRLSTARSEEDIRETEHFSLHESTNLAFHEGQLWDDSSKHARQRWLGEAKASSLTPASAKALSGLLGGESVEPCRELEKWLEMINPAALHHQNPEWTPEPGRLTTRELDEELDDELAQSEDGHVIAL